MNQAAIPLLQRIRRSGLPVILALLGLLLTAMFLGPRVGHAAQASRDATLADCLRYLRTQIAVYAIDHHGVAPGFVDGDVTQTADYPTFIAQLTQPTNEQGHPLGKRSPVAALGPYLALVPANPVTLRTGVLVVNSDKMPSPDESQPYGWFYCPRARQIMPNLSGADAMGVAYSSY